MLSKKIKKLIIILFIIICIIIALVIVNKLVGRNNSSDYASTEFEKDISNASINTEISNVTERNKYYAVKNILGKYINAIVDQGKESTYNMLNPKFISEFGINKENVFSHVESIDTNSLSEDEMNYLTATVNIDSMYKKESSINITTYFIYGKFKYNVDIDAIDFSIIVETDSNNNTFYIYSSEYMKKYYKEESDLSKYNTDIEQIEKNNYNTFEFANVEDATVIMEYLSNYKNMVVEDVGKSYDMLDEEYRDSKFADESEYKKYINDNIDNILSISAKKYKVNKNEDYTEYIIIDQNGNYYVFKENYIMSYKIWLDYYTVDSSEFIQEYEDSDTNKKVLFNIKKLVQALNVKDYKYIYNKLNEQFKNNNYANYEQFSKYMEEKFKDTYDIEFGNSTDENEIYTQEISLNSKSDGTTVKINIIMQLNEGTGFEFSFSIE